MVGDGSGLVRRAGWLRGCRGRPGVALYLVLVFLLLLSLLGAGLALLTSAEVGAQWLYEDQHAAIAAAEAGYYVALSLIRQHPFEPDRWLDSEPDFAARPVGSVSRPAGSRGADGAAVEEQEDGTRRAAWRYSVVRAGESVLSPVTFGVIDEGSRFNLNSFNPQRVEQYRASLLVLPGMTNELVDALIDWLDEDDTPRPGGAESAYYAGLNPPYGPRNGKLGSVEELLLIKGFTPALLYGEDMNQNGVLDPNEDDGDVLDPPDNADGQLDRGIARFLTVYSTEFNITQENTPRVLLTSREGIAALREDFGPQKAAYLQQLLSLNVVLRSPADLLGGNLLRRPQREGQDGRGGGGREGQDRGREPDDREEGAGDGGEDGMDEGEEQFGGAGNRPWGLDVPVLLADSDKAAYGLMLLQDGGGAGGGGTGGGGRGGGAGGAGQGPGADDGTGGGRVQPGAGGRQRGGAGGPRTVPGGGRTPVPRGGGGDDADGEAGNEPNGGGGQAQEEQPIPPSPFTNDDLARLMDRYTVVPPGIELVGRINVNTAPVEVLSMLPGVTAEQAAQMVSVRSTLPVEDRASTAWLLGSGVLSRDAYQSLAPLMTSRASVFRIESVGHSDHSSMQFRRVTMVQVQGAAIRVLFVQDFLNEAPAYDLRSGGSLRGQAR